MTTELKVGQRWVLRDNPPIWFDVVGETKGGRMVIKWHYEITASRSGVSKIQPDWFAESYRLDETSIVKSILEKYNEM